MINNNHNEKRTQNIIVTVFVLALIGVAIYVFRFSSKTTELLPRNVSTTTTQSQSLMSDKETEETLKRVRKLIAVPDENPLVYTVDDAQALIAQQAFFMGSENGDILFIFQQNAKAIIYSPSRNILVNVGPITYNGDAQTQNATTKYEALPANVETSVGNENTP